MTSTSPTMHGPMNDFLCELNFFYREAITAQQQFYLYLSLNHVPAKDPKVLGVLNEEPLFWLTARVCAVQSFFTSVSRIFDLDSSHNVSHLLNIAGKNLDDFSLVALKLRKIKDGISEEDAANYVTDKHEFGAKDIRELKRRVKELRRIWDERYREIRHKVFAHSEYIDARHLFSKTKIDEVLGLLASLDDLHELLWQAYHNGFKPGTRKTITLQFPVTAGKHDLRPGEVVFQQVEAVCQRLKKGPFLENSH